MQYEIEKLAKEIKWTPSKSFENITLISVDKNDDHFRLIFKSDIIINSKELEEFLVCMNENFKYKFIVEFQVQKYKINKSLIIDYLNFIFKIFGKQHLGIIMDDNDISFENTDLKIFFQNNILINEFSNLQDKLLILLQRFGFHFTKINPILKIDKNLLDEEKKKLDTLIQENQRKKKEFSINQIVPQRNNKNYVSTTIKDLKTNELNNVKLDVTFVKATFRPIKTGNLLVNILLTSHDDSIYGRYFLDEGSQEFNFIKSLKFNTNVTVTGRLGFDRFSNQRNLTIDSIKINNNDGNVWKTDNLINERVELSTFTKMSTMDGVSSAQDFINIAKKMKHKGIFINDYENVQVFPEVYNFNKDDSNFKIGYGVKVNIIEKELNVVTSPLDVDIKNSNYIIFDLETTGFYAQVDDIIEFGAIKYENNTEIDRIQFFIKPNKPISKNITELTSITNEIVKDAMSQEEGIIKIKNWISDYILIAHNASFDVSFLQVKYEKYNLNSFNNIVVDTLQLARFLEPKFKSYRLEVIANKYGIHYESSVAHRADYDAKVLLQVFLIMIRKLLEKNIKTFSDLYKSDFSQIYGKQFLKNITITAKNQKGLKKLFKIISKSHTDDFYNKPIVFLEEIIKDREDLLLSSSSYNSRLWNILLTQPNSIIKKEIKLYDYIEVQPPSLFSHLVRRKVITNEELEIQIKKLINFSKEENKIVVATGATHYVHKSDKKYHKILIESKGLGGALHHLFKYNELEPDYPTFNFKSTTEMKEEFNFLKNIDLVEEIVVTNSNKILNLIDRVEIIKDKLYKPEIDNANEKLKNYVYKNANTIYGNNLHPKIQKRLDKELNSIITHNYADIYWIAHKLVLKSLNDGYLVGSRGSIGSSFVATLAQITEVNPLEPHYLCEKCKYVDFPDDCKNIVGYDLPDKKCPKCNISLIGDGHNIPFETFLGFNAEKIPDIDLNFSGDYQLIIHEEARKLFGKFHTFRAGTISTIAERMAFGYAKSWIEKNKLNISRAHMDTLSYGLIGVRRTSGQHPGGIIILPKKLEIEDFTPINFPANETKSSWLTTHFDFNSIHDNLLKLDLLGHDDPTAIKMLVDLTGIHYKDIPNKDPKVLSLFNNTQALGISSSDISDEPTGAMGIPEFGTAFVRKMLSNVNVKSFADLISLSGLSHGTDVWVGNGEKLIQDLGLSLSEIISCRDDIMVYLINQGLDPLLSFEIMESVRKGKGITMKQESQMLEKGVDEWYINSCKKIKYMFPKAHATAYVKMAWRIAWFKIYYPLEYYATYFTTRADVFDIETILKGKDSINKKLNFLKDNRNRRDANKLSNKELQLIPILEIVQEMYARGIQIANININISKGNQWVMDKKQNKLIPPFSSFEGIGDQVAKSIEEARNEMEFTSMQDFIKRTSINSTIAELLKNLGVFNDMPESNQISFDI